MYTKIWYPLNRYRLKKSIIWLVKKEIKSEQKLHKHRFPTSIDGIGICSHHNTHFHAINDLDCWFEIIQTISHTSPSQSMVTSEWLSLRYVQQ